MMESAESGFTEMADAVYTASTSARLLNETSPTRRLVAVFREQAERFTALGLVPLARLAGEHAELLENAHEQQRMQVLDLDGAAWHTGYSKSHLRNLVRTGKLRNVGRKHAPRFLLLDLPIRSGYSPPATNHEMPEDEGDTGAAGQVTRPKPRVPTGSFDVETIARGMLEAA